MYVIVPQPKSLYIFCNMIMELLAQDNFKTAIPQLLIKKKMKKKKFKIIFAV